MRKVIYSMSVSLDGFIAGPAGEINWTGPDDELHRFHNDRVRRQSAPGLLGRRLYEAMLYWEDDAERDPAATETTLDFARIWQPLPKIVFSRTLTQVRGTHTRLAQGTPAEELERLKAEPGEGDIGVGGAGLAAALIAAGLVDDFHLFVAPVVLGAGTRYFPPLEHRIALEPGGAAPVRGWRAVPALRRALSAHDLEPGCGHRMRRSVLSDGSSGTSFGRARLLLPLIRSRGLLRFACVGGCGRYVVLPGAAGTTVVRCNARCS